MKLTFRIASEKLPLPAGRCVAVGLGVALLAVIARASPDETWQSRSWSVDQGLPHSSVECLLHSRDGFLWIGTRNGLARFDGVRFRAFDETEPGFTSDACVDLAEGKPGELWIATKKGLYRRNTEGFTRFSHEQGLPQDAVRRVHSSGIGDLWLATRGGLARQTGKAFEPISVADPIVNGERDSSTVTTRNAECVLDAGQGRVFVGHTDGLWLFDTRARRYDRLWPPTSGKTNTPSAAVREITFDRQGTHWFGTDQELVRYHEGEFRAAPFPTAYGDVRLRRIRVGLREPETLWVVRAGNLYRFRADSGTLESFEGLPGLTDLYVTDVLEDSKGSLWIGTRYGGLVQLRRPLIRVLTTSNGLPHNTVRSVSATTNDGVWVATAGGVGRLRGSRGVSLSFKGERRVLGTSLAIEDSRGRLWLADSQGSGGCFVQTNGTFEMQGGSVHGAGASVGVEDPEGRIWFASESHLACALPAPELHVDTSAWHSGSATNWIHWWIYQPSSVLYHQGFALLQVRADHWNYESPGNPIGFPRTVPLPAVFVTNSPIPIEVPFPVSGIRCLTIAPDGALWIGTRFGTLYRSYRKTFNAVAKADWRSEHSIHSLYFDEQGTFWIGTQNGLAVLSQDRLIPVAQGKDFPDPQVFSVRSDGLGHLWLATGRGLCRVRRDDLVRRMTDRDQPIDRRVFDEVDGMLSSDMGGATERGSCRTGDGKLWFGTAQGLVMLDPKQIPQQSDAPVPFIDRVGFVGGESADPLMSMTLPPGSGRLVEIAYSAREFTSPERIHFRYRLVGNDTRWTEAGTRRVAYFTNLRAGQYEFEVLAFNRDGIRSPEPARLNLILLPRLHETVFFKAAAGLLAIVSITAIHWLRLRATKNAERAELARSLHDQLAGKLASLAKLADETALPSTRGSQPEGSVPDSSGSVLAELARSALRTLRLTIALDGPGESSLPTLVQLLVRQAEELTLPLGLRLRLDIPIEIPNRPVRPMVRKHVSLIASEAFNNIAKHAQAQRVVLRLRFHPEPLVLEIEDDGTGLPTNAGDSTFSGGIEHMRSRARSIQATLTLDSTGDCGMHLRLVVPRL